MRWRVPDVGSSTCSWSRSIAFAAPFGRSDRTPAAEFPRSCWRSSPASSSARHVLGWVDVDLPVQVLALDRPGVPAVPRRARDRPAAAARPTAPARADSASRDAGARRRRRRSASPRRVGAAAAAARPSPCRRPRSAWSCPVLKDAGQADGRRPDTIAGGLGGRLRRRAAAVVLLLRRRKAGPGSRARAARDVRRRHRRVALAVARAARRARCASAPCSSRLQDTTAEIRVRIAVAAARRLRRPRLDDRASRRSSARSSPAPCSASWTATRCRPTRNFRLKLEAVGYGFVVPVFFVSSGLRFDLDGLLDRPVRPGPRAAVPAGAARRPGVLPALLVPPTRPPRRDGRRPAAGDVAAVHRHGYRDRRRDSA